MRKVKVNVSKPTTGPESWKRLKNKDLIRHNVLEIGDGYRAKNREMGSEGLPFARAGNIRGGLDFDGADILSGKSVARAKEKVSQVGDVVITTKGTFGRVALVRPNTEQFVYSPQLCYWRVKNPSIIHPHFLYYWIQGPDFLGQAFKVKSSTDMADYANLRDQRMMSIGAPPLPTQRKIAAILSAYDELIENNRRRIALLERMAEEIYREWFVRLRFPGHEETSFHQGLPTDWGVQHVKEVVVRKRFGKIYRESNLADEGSVIVIDQSRSDCLGFYDGSPEHYASFEKPIILFGDHTCKLVLMTRPFSLAENVIPFESKGSMSTYFLFHLVQGLAQTREYKRHWTILSNKEVLVPTADLQTLFEEAVKPLHRKSETLIEMNRSLTKTRDLLLPRLISGKLSVEDLDIAFPPGMAEEGAGVESTTQQELALETA